MKKVVTLLLVLGIAASANAGLVIGGYDGQMLEPSQNVILTLSLDAPLDPFTGTTWALVASTADATISGGNAIQGILATNLLNGDTAANATVIPPVGQEGIWGTAFNVSQTPAGAAGDVIVDQIMFHCDSEEDVVVSLFEVVEDVRMDQPVDSITIYQVPQPATIALLGLGGLALLRRRK